MPAAVPLVAAVAGSAVASSIPLITGLGGLALGAGLSTGAAATFGALAAKAVGFVVSSGLQSLGGGKKAKRASFAEDARSNVTTQRSSIGTHKIIYGQTRVSGTVVFDGATQSGPNSNGQTVTGVDKFRHFVIVLAGHEVEEIGTIYIEDKPVSLNGDGFVTDAPYIRSSTSETQVSASLSSVTASYVFTTSAAHGFNNGETVYIPVTGAGGRRTYTGYTITATTSTTFTIASGPTLSTILLGDADYPAYVKRTTDTGLKFIRVKKFTGAADQTASPDLVNEINAWTTDHRLRGLAYIYVRIEQAPEFALNIQSISAIVKGKKLYDPRTATTVWSDNAALCVRDYLASSYGFACDSTELNDTYFNSAANICEESVTLKDSTTQDRYTCNGVLDTGAPPLDNLETLLTSLAGVVTYVQGTFRLHAGAYDTPAGTITTSMLAGDVSLTSIRTQRKDLFNAVRGVYVDPNKNYVPTDFPMLTNATYETQDGGQQIVRDIDLPFTNHPEAAQRIAKIALEKSRQGIIVEMPLNHSALKYSVYDTVYVTNAALGWTNKVFRITRISLAAPGPFTLTLQEDTSASYDWNSGEATVNDPAPNTDLPDPFVVESPGNPSVTEELYETRGSSGVKALAIVSWAASADPFARWYVVEYRRVENIDWIVLPPTGATTINIEDIAPGRYEFRVKAINHLGAASSYAKGNPLEIYGLSARPADITGASLQALWGIAHLRWNLPTDLDVRIGGRILIRHSEATSGATWEDSTSIGNETIAGNANGVHLPLKAGTYLIKAEDSSGLTSVNAATITTKDLSLLAFSSLVTVSEDPTFDGTHSGTYVDTGTLRLGGSLLFDSIPDFDSITDLDLAGGVATAGTYTFPDTQDLGSVQSVRLRSVVELTTVNTLDKIDSRTSFIDDWTDFDGTSGGGNVDCYVEMRETDDNPSGSPTWTSWQRLDVADRNARAFQFRAQLTSADPAYNVQVSTLGVTISELV